MTLHTPIYDFTDSYWLSAWEKREALEALLYFNILKWSNKRNLPLKSGSQTDIYVNLRQARDTPEAMRFFAQLFSHPLKRLRVDRVAEIPQAVTCFSGLISSDINKPLVTIRDQAKQGRATDANLIGDIRPGELIGLFDDVITDGQSKLSGYQTICQRGARPVLVVAVDRQQGWRETFKALNVNMPVWSGMTLHDIRAFLIEKGIMERCPEEVELANNIIIALDGKPWSEILPIVDELRTTGVILKVNDLLFDMGIENLVPMLSVYGRVMVDLKSHDIPNTVLNVCRRLAKYEPWACTVHASGGLEMIQAAKRGLAGKMTKVLAVTVLTSINEKRSEAIYRRNPRTTVKDLAHMAWNDGAGADGFVCSPQEVSMLRKLFPQALIVTPGVRSPGAARGDQARVDTPAHAISAGANYIVGGRQFFAAPNPVTEVRRVQQEEIDPNKRSGW